MRVCPQDLYGITHCTVRGLLREPALKNRSWQSFGLICYPYWLSYGSFICEYNENHEDSIVVMAKMQGQL